MTYAPILRWDNGVLKPVLVETSEGLKIAFDEELCDCECGDEAPSPCDCECGVPDHFLASWDNVVDCMLTQTTYNPDPPVGDCLAIYNAEAEGCTSSDGMYIYQIELRCNHPDHPGRWTITVSGEKAGFILYWGTKVLPEDPCLIPGNYSVEIYEGGDGEAYTTTITIPTPPPE